jgi:hypothetical protein
MRKIRLNRKNVKTTSYKLKGCINPTYGTTAMKATLRISQFPFILISLGLSVRLRMRVKKLLLVGILYIFEVDLRVCVYF